MTPPTPTSDAGLQRFLRGRLSGRQLLARRNISNISFLLTYRCPAECDHCAFECDMGRKGTIDPRDAKVLVAAAARQNPPPSIAFSGGEPFLELDLMADLGRFAQSKGMAWEVMSSSAWCTGPRLARDVLSRLKCLGLATYGTSVDPYHMRRVQPRRIADAVGAARNLGLRVCVNTMRHPRGREYENRFIAGALHLPPRALKEFQINRMITVPAGRARSHVADFFYRDKDLAEGCPYSTEAVTMSPSGNIYPCCGMVAGENSGAARLFVFDRIKGKGVDQAAAMLAAMKNDLFFRLLQTFGPYRLLKQIVSRHPRIKTRSRFVGTCDVCLEFAQNPGVIRAMRKLLAQMRLRMLNA